MSPLVTMCPKLAHQHLTGLLEGLESHDEGEVAIVTHKVPDADALASAWFIAWLIVTKFRRRCRIYVSGQIPGHYAQFVPRIHDLKELHRRLGRSGPPIITIGVDIHDIASSHVSAQHYRNFLRPLQWAIDHHKWTEAAPADAWVDTSYGACILQIIELVQEFGLWEKLQSAKHFRDMATIAVAAILNDMRCEADHGRPPETLCTRFLPLFDSLYNAADHEKLKGLNPTRLHEFAVHRETAEQNRLRLHQGDEGSFISYAGHFKNCSGFSVLPAIATHFLNTGYRFVVVGGSFVEDEGEPPAFMKVSFRSPNDGPDCQVAAQIIKGGGSAHQAAGTVPLHSGSNLDAQAKRVFSKVLLPELRTHPKLQFAC